jgi:hypothetical protein
MAWCFGDEGIEAGFGRDIEEGSRDRHLDYVVFQDWCGLDRFYLEESDPLGPAASAQGHLSRGPGVSHPGHLSIGCHEPAFPSFLH